MDAQKNLVICPLPYDGAFMEIFYKGWEVVQSFILADARLPREVQLPSPAQRQVARRLEERRDYAVLGVIDALAALSQPELLDTNPREADLAAQTDIETEMGAALAPVARLSD